MFFHVVGVFEHSGRYLHMKSSMKDEKGVDVGEEELRSSSFSTIPARSLPVDEVIKGVTEGVRRATGVGRAIWGWRTKPPRNKERGWMSE